MIVMENELNKVLKLLENYEVDKIQQFQSILTDMELRDENILQGLLYYCLKANKISLDIIKEEFSQKTFETISILEKLDKINYSQQDEEEVVTDWENILRASYQDIDKEELETEAIKAILNALDDPYTYYMSPDETENFNADVLKEMISDYEFSGLINEAKIMDNLQCGLLTKYKKTEEIKNFIIDNIEKYE